MRTQTTTVLTSDSAPQIWLSGVISVSLVVSMSSLLFLFLFSFFLLPRPDRPEGGSPRPVLIGYYLVCLFTVSYFLPSPILFFCFFPFRPYPRLVSTLVLLSTSQILLLSYYKNRTDTLLAPRALHPGWRVKPEFCKRAKSVSLIYGHVPQVNLHK